MNLLTVCFQQTFIRNFIVTNTTGESKIFVHCFDKPCQICFQVGLIATNVIWVFYTFMNRCNESL